MALNRVFVFLFLSVLLPVSAALGAEFTSSSFQMLDPVMNPAGFSTSSSYQLIGTIAQVAIGTSTASSFQLRGGFGFFPTATTPALSTTAGNAQVSLSWTVSQGFLGWTVSGYNVGVATASSSGPFSYTSLGDVTSSTRTGLTNGTRYFFVIRAEDAFGNSVASSSVVSSVPTTAAMLKSESFNFTNEHTFTMDTSGTDCTFTMPANFFTEDVELRAFAYPASEFKTTKPPLSGTDFMGNTFDFNFHTLNNSSQVTSLSAAVSIRCTYTDADISGIQESSLKPYRRASYDTSWTELSGATLDTVNNTITFSTQSFSSFALIGTLTPTPAASPVSSGGGGGGGGGSDYAPTIPLQDVNTVITGFSYPGAEVTILKDGAIHSMITADANGKFSISGNFTLGITTFSFYATDANGIRSITMSFTTNILAGGLTTIAGVVIPPTISTDKSQVKYGNEIKFFGSSYPQSQVNVIINSENPIYDKTTVNAVGIWNYTLNSGALEFGNHTIRSQTVMPTASASGFSESLAFQVGDHDVAFVRGIRRPPAAACSKKGDINNDTKINIVDFSILLYFWNQQHPLNTCADINADRIVNLFDFSIILYWWTG